MYIRVGGGEKPMGGKSTLMYLCCHDVQYLISQGLCK